MAYQEMSTQWSKTTKKLGTIIVQLKTLKAQVRPLQCCLFNEYYNIKQTWNCCQNFKDTPFYSIG